MPIPLDLLLNKKLLLSELCFDIWDATCDLAFLLLLFFEDFVLGLFDLVVRFRRSKFSRQDLPLFLQLILQFDQAVIVVLVL